MLAFRSLDPFRALREPDRRRRDEERLSRSEQRTLSKTQNNHLTGKAPYKFESASLQRRVRCEPDFGGTRVQRRLSPVPQVTRDGFEACLAIAPCDAPSKVFLERIAQFRDTAHAGTGTVSGRYREVAGLYDQLPSAG